MLFEYRETHSEKFLPDFLAGYQGFIQTDNFSGNVNNFVENLIRPFVVDRKNRMFADTPQGAHTSAVSYTFMENVKANGHDPYWYFRSMPERLPFAKTEEDHKALLPQFINRNEFNTFLNKNHGE